MITDDVIFIAVQAMRIGPRTSIGSAATEDQWLPIIGPTSYCAARWIERHVGPNEVKRFAVMRFADALGVKTSVLAKSLDRLVRFNVARWDNREGVPLFVLEDHWLPASQSRSASAQHQQKETET